MGRAKDDAVDPLFERLRGGDRAAAAELIAQQRERLRRMIDLRLDPRLRGRLDASDVLQDAMLDIASRLEDYLKDPKIPFFLWRGSWPANG